MTAIEIIGLGYYYSYGIMVYYCSLTTTCCLETYLVVSATASGFEKGGLTDCIFERLIGGTLLTTVTAFSTSFFAVLSSFYDFTIILVVSSTFSVACYYIIIFC